MNVFSIIGPVMIGPSSSHTAGACRIGRIVYYMLNGKKLKKVKIELSGSFARTYRGHGTDRAILAGVMGYDTDSIEIRSALEIAKDRGIDYEFIPTVIHGAHSNTARITYYAEDGSSGSLQGASIGGGNIRIDEINEMPVHLSGERTACLVFHKDVPGVIAEVTNLIAEKYSKINICSFSLCRQKKGGLALMAMEFDSIYPAGLKEDIMSLEHVVNVVAFEAI